MIFCKRSHNNIYINHLHFCKLKKRKNKQIINPKMLIIPSFTDASLSKPV